jgi:hypothetical protein
MPGGETPRWRSSLEKGGEGTGGERERERGERERERERRGKR